MKHLAQLDFAVNFRVKNVLIKFLSSIVCRILTRADFEFNFLDKAYQ